MKASFSMPGSLVIGTRHLLHSKLADQLRELCRYSARHLRRRIPAGPNEGLWWSVASAGRGYGSGTFEPARAQTIAALIQEGECFWDVGAHKGYVTLIAGRRVGRQGEVRAFEPCQSNLWFLRKHVEWNRLENVRVEAAALSSFEGTGWLGGGSSLARKLGEGDETVTVLTVQSLLADGTRRPPTLLKIDVEGAEVEVLRGAEEWLRGPDQALLVSVHSADLYRSCAELLRATGYRVIESSTLIRALAHGWDERVFPDGRADPDLLALGPGRTVDEAVIECFAA